MEQGTSVSTWSLVAMLLLAALAACADKGEAGPTDGKWGQGVYVDRAWSFAREVEGHRIHVGQKKLECSNCHTPTETGMGPVTPARCATCHEKESHIEHASAQAEARFGAGTKAVCTTCHAFTLEGTRHDEAMLKGEAPRVRLDDGSAGKPTFGVESYAPGECKRCHATAQGNTPAIVVHSTQPCLSCHAPHEGAPQSAPCSNCHSDITTTHASEGKTLVETCKTCHENQHAPAKDALGTCVTCHAQKQPIIPATALFAGGHTECTGCHRPHDFEKSDAAPCRSCHEQVNVIGGGTIAAHNGCTNCHSPHDVKAAPAACPTCHKDVHSDHPKQGATCVGCHDPHPSHVTTAIDVKACSSCHGFADSDHGAHGGAGCTDCHKPHQFGLELSNVATCEGCHGTQVHETVTNKGHQACTNCHLGLPHRPEPQKVACTNCHQHEGALVNKAHQQCTSCHEPHSGAQTTPCGSCHQAERQTAPTGHQVCTTCHEPHAGLPVLKACANCHRTEAKSPHGQVSTGCQTCHRPHGPTGPTGPAGVAALPACSMCHEVAKLPGLHAESKHQPCERCHSGHEEPNAMARQICVSCHQDRANHFPESPRCVSCHLFTATP